MKKFYQFMRMNTLCLLSVFLLICVVNIVPNNTDAAIHLIYTDNEYNDGSGTSDYECGNVTQQKKQPLVKEVNHEIL